ncbi:PAN2-PAN3 deadenylation complex subunit PAN3 [Mycena kentingensis (nom. inval.)]|nr:PAN2-PAN3 deadenylation complex subunit PAN3 [Mycena kentingensis (nom. inval.)]
MSNSDAAAVLPTASVSMSALDIEHTPVIDDPRAWSDFRKNVVLILVASASMIAGLAANIQNPAIEDMERSLHATSSQISLSISLFIVVQGTMPLLWTAVSEIKGRKIVYVCSIAIFAAGSVVVATSKTIALVIAFRTVQAAGSSAVMAIGAATLADIFDPVERGTKMGVYYIAPLLGPSLAPIMGGVLTTAFNWRGPFWFLAVVSGTSCTCIFVFFKDTFRKERSLTYQSVLRARIAEAREKARKTANSASTNCTVMEQEKPPTTLPALPADLEKQQTTALEAMPPAITLSLRDVNPMKPLWLVMRRMNNVVILLASGLMFAYNFVVVYTASRALETQYGYDALETGFVLLSFGTGNLVGSLLGGKYSDMKLAQLTAANGDVGRPEMRLQSTMVGLVLLPPCVLAFGWVSAKQVHVSAMCVFLFLSGLFAIWAYASTLAYIVDANNGRSSTVVAANSAFRGLFAFIAVEVAVPLQDSVGDGWTYTIWAVLLAIVGGFVWLVATKGGRWRERAEQAEEAPNATPALVDVATDTPATYQSPSLRATSPPITATPVISSPAPSLAANAVHAPIFVPKLPMRVQSPAAPTPPMSPSPPQDQSVYLAYEETSANGYYSDPGYPDAAYSDPTYSEAAYTDATYDAYNHGHDDYYGIAGPVFMRQPLNYHLYSTPIPATFLVNARDTHFVPPSSDLRTELQIRSEDLNTAAPPGLGMPEEMQGYHSIVPLDNLTADRHKFQNNWNSTVYRAINSKDGLTYCLRRVENFRMTNQSAFGSVETWSKLRHPNIVALHEAFTTHAFGDSSLVVAYTYHPKARTLHETYLKTTAAQGTSSSYNSRGHARFQSTSSSAVAALPERLLWSYIIQIATAIKSVHDAGHAVRMIDPTKILVIGKNRLCIGSCGIVDVLMHDAGQAHAMHGQHNSQDIHTLQQEDLTHFGRLVLALISGQMMGWSGNNFQRTIDLMARVYSPDVKTVALYLFNKGHHKHIGQALDMIGTTRISAEMADALTAHDILENEMITELENARLVRLLCKLGFINERPEFARDDRWSETGDRYIIKLFRDYVFHQIDETGNPNVNIGHVLACLNKLDAGTEEKLLLTSRNEQSCLVVNYKQVKACIQSAFEELARPEAGAGPGPYGWLDRVGQT